MKTINTLLLVILIAGFGFAQENNRPSQKSDPSNNAIPFNNSDNSSAARNTELVYLRLRASTSSNNYSTDVYFNPNASLGFDLGYDASFFGAPPAFVIFSELVEGSTGIPLVLQAVNSDDINDVTIPLGVNATAGVELTFRLITSTLPASISIVLDDTVANTSTVLTDSDYVLTPTSALSGIGRFFLRISAPSITYTYTDGVWSPNDPNGVALAGDDLIITSGNAAINANTTCNSVIVNPGAGLTVNTGIILETSNGLELESSSTSYSSLILDGTVNGGISYERHVNINGAGTTGSNDLISAPLTGQSFSDVAANNPNIFNNGTLFLFGPYDKTTGAFVTWAGTETATLDAGVGYRAATSDNSSVTFSGTAENGAVSTPVVNGGPVQQIWNLIGNPYPSYMDAFNFVNDNLGTFDGPSLTAGIWGYDGSAINGWTLVNLANAPLNPLVAPGQGFFVSAGSAGNFNFDPSWRETGTSDDYIVGRNAELVYMKLKLSSSTNNYATDFFFNPNASLGLDLGYDAGFFGDALPNFSLYSSLVENNTGERLTLQALNSTDVSDVTIPLGVNATQGQELRFSIAESTLPANVQVYLDDTVANTTTLLNDSDYVVTPTSDLSGTGRFFLRTSEDALSTIDNSLDLLDIYTLKASSELVVSGQLLNNNTTLNLFDIQGRLVLTTKLDSAQLQNRIDVSNINSGIYIVNIHNSSQQKTQKVIIN